MNPLSLLTQLLNAIGSCFGYVSKRSDLNNSAEMQKRETLRLEKKQDDDDAKDIQQGNVDRIRCKLD
jgi:hypothetical protein